MKKDKIVNKEIKKYNKEMEKVIKREMSALEKVLGREVPIHQQKRIKIAALELMQGYSPQQIAHKYAEEWGIKVSTINCQLMTDARKFIHSQILTEDNDIRMDLVAKYYYLYQKNMEDGDLVEARKVLDSLSNLVKKIENKVNIIGDIKTIVIEEVSNYGGE